MNVLFIGSDDLRPNLGIYSGTCLSSQIPFPIVLMIFSFDCKILFLIDLIFCCSIAHFPCPISGANEGVFASPAMVTPNLDKVSK